MQKWGARLKGETQAVWAWGTLSVGANILVIATEAELWPSGRLGRFSQAQRGALGECSSHALPEANCPLSREVCAGHKGRISMALVGEKPLIGRRS